MNEREQRYEANRIILAMVGGDKELADLWWTSYNKHFSQSPNAAWQIDHERVMMYLYSMDGYF